MNGTLSMGGFLRRFAAIKWRLGNNHLGDLRSHLWVHFAIAMLVLVLLIGGGTIFFTVIFDFLMRQEPFGPPLMDRLMKMVLLAFFSMLIFSNLIIMLTTTYFSKEVEFLMSLPIPRRPLFFGKLGESMIYSSWAFVILSFPFFVALGRSRELDWTFYAAVPAVLLPYLIIPGALGAAAALLVTSFFPPRQLLRYAVGLVGAGLLSAVVYHQFYGIPSLLRAASQEGELVSMMRLLGAGDVPWLPSSWLGRALLAIEREEWREAGFWGLALWSTAAMGLVVCDWLAGPLYYRGWCTAKNTAGPRRGRRALFGGLYRWIDTLLRPLPGSTRALVVKDVAVFWRDPTQWGQLAMLFGLLFIYMINLRSAAGLGRFPIFTSFWQSVISLFNIGATGFVLSILTTRFVLPMLSLEGRQQWVIGLAPISRTRIVWVKFLLSSFAAMLITLPLALLSSYLLKADWVITGLTVATALLLSVGLSSLAVGLGALLPNFTEDDPSRIANGLGGTLNAILSLVYILLSLALVTPLVQTYLTGGVTENPLARALLYVSIPLWLLLHLTVAWVPLRLGLNHWRRIEF